MVLIRCREKRGGNFRSADHRLAGYSLPGLRAEGSEDPVLSLPVARPGSTLKWKGGKRGLRMQKIKRGARDQENHGHDFKPEYSGEILLLAERRPRRGQRRSGESVRARLGEAELFETMSFSPAFFSASRRFGSGGKGCRSVIVSSRGFCSGSDPKSSPIA